MLFNSIEFLLFLPIVFILYWFVFNRNLKIQNIFIVTVSYLFYGWWDWRFLILIAFTTFLSWLSGLLIYKFQFEDNPKQAKIVSLFNIVVNLLILGIFKYFNFFADSFFVLFQNIGLQLNSFSLKIILPVGISFYTFQALSYSIDVYKKRLLPTRDIVAFFAYVSFFPQLVAGPIERATQLLPQFLTRREFDYKKSIEGLRQILWGLFKKVVIADNCATVVNAVFANYQDEPAVNLFWGAVLFAFQIYGDFSGYSDIAIGTAKLFGIKLMRNFNYPYFSRDIAEFWRKWHISLTTWFRDYLYIPLGGSRGTKWQTVRNTFIIFLVSGFWHGANWTFIFWGFFHALLFLPLLFLGKNRKNVDLIAKNSFFPSIKEFSQMVLTFLLVVVGWVFFRASSITLAFNYLEGMFSTSLFRLPTLHINTLLVFLAFMLFVEWVQREKSFGLEAIETFIKYRMLRWGFYIVLILSIIQFGGSAETFIYFQF